MYNGLIDNPIKRTPVERTITPITYNTAKYTKRELETIRFHEEIKNMIAEGINTLLNKKLIMKNVSDNINKYY